MAKLTKEEYEKKSKENYEEWQAKIAPDPKRAVILFADIMDCSEISNNHSIAEYTYIINQFHRSVKDTAEFLGLDNYTSKKVELSIKGDETCLILHTEKTSDEVESIQIDIRDAIIFAISLKLIWRASEYNQMRVLNGQIPRDVAIGINEGNVSFYRDPELHPWRDELASEGYAINLAKRIESESRNGNYSKIMASGSVRHLAKKLKLGDSVIFSKKPHKPEAMKGFSTYAPLYEIVKIRESFVDTIRKLFLEACNFDAVIEQMKYMKQATPKDFWNSLLVDFNDAIRQDKTTMSSSPMADTGNEELNKIMSEAMRARFGGEYDRAVELYTEAYEKSKDINILMERAASYYFVGKHEEALSDLDAYLAEKSDDGTAHRNRGRVLGDLGRYDEAINSLKTTMLIEPDYFSDRLDISELYVVSLYSSKAATMIDESLKISDSYEHTLILTFLSGLNWILVNEPPYNGVITGLSEECAEFDEKLIWSFTVLDNFIASGKVAGERKEAFIKVVDMMKELANKK